MPQARPMPCIGPRCLELRIKDKSAVWRIFCRVDTDSVLMVAVLAKKTRQTPQAVIKICVERLRAYDRLMEG